MECFSAEFELDDYFLNADPLFSDILTSDFNFSTVKNIKYDDVDWFNDDMLNSEIKTGFSKLSEFPSDNEALAISTESLKTMVDINRLEMSLSSEHNYSTLSDGLRIANKSESIDNWNDDNEDEEEINIIDESSLNEDCYPIFYTQDSDENISFKSESREYSNDYTINSQALINENSRQNEFTQIENYSINTENFESNQFIGVDENSKANEYSSGNNYSSANKYSPAKECLTDNQTQLVGIKKEQIELDSCLKVKSEPEEAMLNLDAPVEEKMYYFGGATYMNQNCVLPPSPPSSNGSDRDSPPPVTKLRSIAPAPTYVKQPMPKLSIINTRILQPTASLYTNMAPTNGTIFLTDEERRTMVVEGYPIPCRYPLTKQDEKNLKKVRRKIKNKLSAQESRRKKKEYVECLEKKMEIIIQENCSLRKKLDALEGDNKALTNELETLKQNLTKKKKVPTATLR